ncbi:MAG: amino acid adenylation domain-containing protein, partial [bacterium]|nr:amino acid adenylation domain-containing protein [bacterium]
FLCAYFVSPMAMGKDELTDHLAHELPEYMIPQHFIQLEQIPLTPNGKVDRKALPVPDMMPGSSEYTPPRNKIEEKLVSIWSEVLHITAESVSIDDNFFELGGHSLNATLVISRIKKELDVKIPLAEVFTATTVRKLAGSVRGAEVDKYQSIEPVEKRDYYPLSPAQKRLYFLHQMDPRSINYNMPQMLEFLGELDPFKLERIFQQLIHRHETFRTSFTIVEGDPVQRVHDPDSLAFELRFYELDEEKADQLISDFSQPFDFSQPPLLRGALIKVGEEWHILAVDLLHISADGVSFGILVRDFMALYEGEELAGLKLQYKDFSQWQNGPKGRQQVKQQQQYWLNRFAGEVPAISLPTDYARPSIQNFEGETIRFALDKKESLMLKELALSGNASIFMVLLANFNILLSKVSGNEDIIIGTGTAGRRHESLNEIIGMFVNTLALRNTPRSNQTFPGFLEDIKKNTLNDFENQDYPFEDLVEKLDLKRDTSRNPIFDVSFQFNNQEVPELEVPGLRVSGYKYEWKTSKFDLTLWGWEGEEQLKFAFQYTTSLFKRETIDLFIRYFKEIAGAITRDAQAPNQQLWEIRQMSPGTKEAILLEMNQALEAEEQRMLKYGQIIQRPLNESLKKFRDKIAVEYGTTHLSYGELDQRSNRVAHQLVAKGIKKGASTGVLMEDRVSLVLTIIGILKAGGVFAILDPDLPQSRLAFMVESIGMEFIFTDKANGNFIADSENLKQQPMELTVTHHWFEGKEGEEMTSPGEAPALQYQPEDQIYVYFTSGSTGTPKAIVGKNISLLHFIQWEIDTLDMGDTLEDTLIVSQLTAPGFDAFLRDLFVPLLTGGRLCIPLDRDIKRDSDALTHWLGRSRIHVVHCVPALFRQLKLTPSNRENYKTLRYVLLSGEKTHHSDLMDWIDEDNGLSHEITFFNLYGPTETTMTKTWHIIGKEDLKRPRIPVGKPMRGVGIMVLDENMNLCDRLVTGDIYICTPYSSHGYYNDPALTNQSFLENPYSAVIPKTSSSSASSAFSAVKLYKTGDFGKVLPNYTLDLMGRNDRQVKLLGIRIQLEGVESVLKQHPLVKEAVVIKKESSAHNQWLCAYMTTAEEDREIVEGTVTGAIEEYLAEILPSYLVPSQLVTLEEIPRTPTGKIDYPALADLEEKKESYLAPQGEVEQKLHDLWAGLFKLEKISVTDNFFALGGNSLNVIALIARIRKVFDVLIPPADIFNNPTIQKQAALIRPETPTEKYSAIQPVEKRDYYPMSSAQKRLFFLYRMDMDSTSYNIPQVMKLEGSLDEDKLEECLWKLVQKHESLRTSFFMKENEPMQKIHPEVGFEIKMVTHPAGEDTLIDMIRDFVRPFDLSRAPLIRSQLIRMPGENYDENDDAGYTWMIDMHHIISDGTSMGVLVKEFMAFYEGRELPQPRLHYKDYSQWENPGQERIRQQKAFWLKEFEEEIPVLELPLDYSRPKSQQFEGAVLNFGISANHTRELKELALDRGTTLYNVLMAIYTIFLSKISNQENIVVGTPTAGRRHADLEQIIGMFIDTLALKNEPRGEKLFYLFLAEVHDKTLDAFDNQDYHYEDLVEKVMANRDASRNPLFDTMLVLQNMDVPAIEIPGLKLKPVPFNRSISKFDLTLLCIETDERLWYTFEYSTTLFKHETIQRFARYLINILSTVAVDTDQRISAIDILTSEEKRQLVEAFNDTTEEFPTDKTIYQLIEEQVEHIPDHVALVGQITNPNSSITNQYDGFITYKELNNKTNRLARYLYSEKGVRPGQPVAVLMERSMELIISLTGVMKAGGAYVPLDPSLPPDRLRLMFNDASIGMVISQQKFIKKLAPLKNQCPAFHSLFSIDIPPMDDPESIINKQPPLRPDIIGGAGHPAYVMYTSGSSGTPKGVLVEHRTIVNTLIWRKNYYDYRPGDVSLRNPPYFFDSSVTDIFTPLLGGARLVLVPEAKKTDLETLKQVIPSHNVSHFIAVPAFYNVMLEEIPHALTHVKHICVAGEHFPDALIRKHFSKLPHVRVSNEYGPTENSVNSTAYELKPGSPKALIGQPISNVNVYILDRHQCLSPIGVTGEICLAGSSLARGYLNNPEMTMERFIDMDFSHGWTRINTDNHGGGLFKIYKTGDMARWLADGNIEFLGRTDTQVKIRGIRVEIEEIESHLMQFEGIKEAVVLAHTRDESPSEKYLCAYYVPVQGDYIPVQGDYVPVQGDYVSSGQHDKEDQSDLSTKLRSYLSGKLPQYMVPSYFMPIEKIPFTPGGKIDRKVLPVPGVQGGNNYVSPKDEVETKLVEIWSGLLGKYSDDGTLLPIGIDDDFFSIGGDSIKAIQILSRITNAGYKTDIRTLFEYPTIRELAPRLTESDMFRDQSPVTGAVPLSPIQEWFFRGSPVYPHHYNQSVMFHSGETLDAEIIKAVFTRIQKHHDVLRMTYKRDMENGEMRITQTNHGLDYPLSVEEFDFSGRGYEDSARLLEAKANEIQAGIDLEKGPLMRPVLFHLDDGSRLLIVIHHLVIDGISWRILFEDIQHLMRQYKNNEPIELPLKTDSFKTWSEKLHEYAGGEELLKERTYWEQLGTQPIPIIKNDFEEGSNLIKETASVSFRLGTAQTNALLTTVNHAYGTEINDILLTALGLAVRETWGHSRLFIALEGHGREELFEDIDISRTVGWFTSEYPVLMDISYEYEGDLGRQIKEIKETLRKVPNKGIGYGILEYLTLTGGESDTEPAFEVKPQVSFNYLGQFDADVRQTGFQVAVESAGAPRNENEQRDYELAVSGMIGANRLTISIEYSKNRYKSGTMKRLSSFFKSSLLKVKEFCASREKRELTPSDFTYPHLPLETLDRLNHQYPDVIQDLYLLTPMQRGMLFHTLYDRSSEAYFEQVSYGLHGVLDMTLAEKSLNELFKRYDVLRTTFVHQGVEEPVQIVLSHRSAGFYYEDLRHITGNRERKEFVENFITGDRRRSFDLGNDPLMRVSFLRTGESDYECIWSFHHILMDGWCSGILNAEFFVVYAGLLDNHTWQLPPVTPYRNYIKWLEKQDLQSSGNYWEGYLDSYDESAAVPGKKYQASTTPQAAGYKLETLRVEFDRQTTSGFNALAGKNRVTINTIVQTIWAILLGKYNGKEDVVFGSVVSGRPADLEGVESIVGLFINTVPVRIRFDPQTRFNRLLHRVQAEAIDSKSHHYHSLAKIQSQSLLKTDLINHILTFENYPITDRIKGYEGNKSQMSLTLSHVDAFEQTNYDFNVTIHSGNRLTVRFDFNGNVFDGEIVRPMGGHFRRVIEQVIDDETIKINALTLLSDSEKYQLLVEFNDTEASYPKDKSIHQLFEEQVERTTDSIALVGGNQPPIIEKGIMQLSYRALNERSNQLALLLKEKGIFANTIVGIMVERSVEMIIGIFGILKAGGAYLPIDPDYPEERIEFMLRDSGAKIIVSNGLKVNGLDGLMVKKTKTKPSDANEFPHRQTNKLTNQQTNLAYVIYTSGSTGKPKGVMIDHHSVVNRLKWMQSAYAIGKGDVILQKTAFTFDVSVWELFWWSWEGARLCLLEPGAEKDP